MRRGKEMKQNKTQAEKHSIWFPIDKRLFHPLDCNENYILYRLLQWDWGMFTVQKIQQTLPLPTDACTGLLSQGGLLVFMLHKNIRPPVAATNWAPAPPPCHSPSASLLLSLYLDNTGCIAPEQGWPASSDSTSPETCRIRDAEPCAAPRGAPLCSNSSPPCLMWLTAAILPEKRSDSLGLWEHTGDAPFHCR